MGRQPPYFLQRTVSVLLRQQGRLRKPVRVCKIPFQPDIILYEEVCAEVVVPKQKEELCRMIGFRFIRRESPNLSEEHLQAIEKHLEGQGRKLLAFPTRRIQTRRRRSKSEYLF